MNQRSIWILIQCVALCSMLHGQRRYATFDARSIDESLHFDVNNVPVDSSVQESVTASSSSSSDFNFSPNVVFSSDSKRAFITVPGSDRVLVFDPSNAAAIAQLEVGPNPGRLVLSPDGRSLATVCLDIDANLPTSGSTGSRVASLAVIDVETLEVRRGNLTGVQFSFVNVPVFSPDGNFLYVASMGTDELLRIGLSDLQESGSRLAFMAGTRPGAITLSPDGSELAIVLIGSSGLDRIEHPDAVAFVGLDDFQVLRKVSPETGEGSALSDDEEDEIIHDFTALSRFTYSNDGKYGLVADQQIGELAMIPELTSDRVWIYDVAEDAFLHDPLYVDAVALSTWATPTGGFLVVSSLTLTLFDPDEVKQAWEDDEDPIIVLMSPSRSFYRPRTKPLFSTDGETLYIAAPLHDTLLAIHLETLEIQGIDVGGDVERVTVSENDDDEIEQLTNVYASAPLDISLSPDGSILAVVNLNADTVDLVGPSDTFYFPAGLCDDEWFTGIAAVGLGTETAHLRLRAFNAVGGLVSDDPDTEDTVEYVSPVGIDLATQRQLARTAEELFQAAEQADEGTQGDLEDPGSSDDQNDVESAEAVDGWVEGTAEVGSTRSLFMIGDRTLDRLDGVPVQAKTAQRLVLPDVRVDSPWNTEILLLNPNLSSTEIRIDLIDQRGRLVETELLTMSARALIRALVHRPDDDEDDAVWLFGDAVFEPCSLDADGSEDEAEDEDEDLVDNALHCGFTEGYLMVRVEPKVEEVEDGEDRFSVVGGILAWERILDAQRLALLSGVESQYEELRTSGGEEEGTVSFLLPQVVAGGGTATSMNLVNPTKETLNLNLSLWDSDGVPIAAERSLSLLPGHSLRATLDDFFALGDGPELVDGWARIDVDRDGLCGDVLIELGSGTAATALPLQTSLTGPLTFSHVAQESPLATGLALLNPSSESVGCTLRLFSADGTEMQAQQLTLAPDQRILRLLDEIFPELTPQTGGHLEVSATGPLAGLEIFFHRSLQFVSAVVPQ